MTDKPRVAVVGALRTPIGAFLGNLQACSAVELGSQIICALIRQSGLPVTQIDEVIMGQVYTGGVGPNPARQAALNAGLPHSCIASTINMVCGSGLRSIHNAVNTIQQQQADCIIAGGMESMSQAPFVSPDMRSGHKMGHSRFIDSLIHDALWDPTYDCHMGITAENLAELYSISRDEQDAYAALSQQRCEAAQTLSLFETEISPISIPHRKGEPLIIDRDEYPKSGVTQASIQKLRPAFKTDGSVTAANSSGINDGAAALMLMNENALKASGLKALAYITENTCVGVDPKIMGIGPAPAIQQLLRAQQLQLNDIQCWEINEAFAAQVIAVCKELSLDPALVNLNGGAIALGHPVGASGARIIVTLIHDMLRRRAAFQNKNQYTQSTPSSSSLNSPISLRGVAALCIGGGMGIASLLELA